MVVLPPVSYTHLDVYKRQVYSNGDFVMSECMNKWYFAIIYIDNNHFSKGITKPVITQKERKQCKPNIKCKEDVSVNNTHVYSTEQRSRTTDIQT